MAKVRVRFHCCSLFLEFSLQITKDEFFAEVVQDILLYVSRDLSDKVHVLVKF